MRSIPTRTDLTDYVLTVELDGVDFDLRFLWNGRDETWYMTVTKSLETIIDADTGEPQPIMAGIPVNIGTPLMRNNVDLRRPAGEFMAFDTTGAGLNPGINDLGARVVLYYIEADDL